MQITKLLKKAATSLLAATLILSAAGCTKTVQITSEIEGTEGSDYIIGWEDAETSSNDVLTSTSSPSSNGEDTSPQNNGGTSSVFTPQVNFNVYENIPKNVKQIKVLLWYTPDDAEKKVISSFEDKFGIKVKLICTDNAGYLTRLTTLVASNDAPDVAALYDFPAPVIKGLFNTVDVATSDKGGAFNFEKDLAYDTEAMKYASWNGKQYGVQLKGNWHADRGVIIFNRTLFKNQGITDPLTLWKQGKWNWKTLEQCAKDMTFKNKSNGIQVYGFGPSNQIPIFKLLASAGTNIITINNDKGTISNNVTDKTVIEGVSLYTRMKKSGYCVPGGSDWSMFTKGQCAMWLSEHNQVKVGREFDSMTDDWTTVPIPSPEGKEIISAYTSTSFGIPKGAKNGIAGSYFIRWLLDSNNWNIRATFKTQEMYDTWVKQQSYKTSYDRIAPILNNSSGLINSLVNITAGSENDVATGLKSLMGSVDNAINTTLNEMSTK